MHYWYALPGFRKLIGPKLSMTLQTTIDTRFEGQMAYVADYDEAGNTGDIQIETFQMTDQGGRASVRRVGYLRRLAAVSLDALLS